MHIHPFPPPRTLLTIDSHPFRKFQILSHHPLLTTHTHTHPFHLQMHLSLPLNAHQNISNEPPQPSSPPSSAKNQHHSINAFTSTYPTPHPRAFTYKPAPEHPTLPHLSHHRSRSRRFCLVIQEGRSPFSPISNPAQHLRMIAGDV